MKIGILTFHNADNYGAVLQCYALQEKLKTLHTKDEVYIVDYKCPKIVNAYIPKINLKKPWSILGYIKTKKKCKQFHQFREKYFNLGTDNLSFYDVIYYGSDQIWSPSLTGYDFTYFGKGFSGKKIAYAASDGGNMILTDEIKNELNSFAAISCREASLTNKLSPNNLSTPTSTICDPVFLLSKDEWLKMAKLPQEKNYVLTYKIRENLNFDSEAEKIGRLLGKKVIQIVYVKQLRKLFYHGQHFVEGISPEQFVGYFAKADFVLTTSFHGTAFSIIFNKPFYVLKIDNASERITDLLTALNIEDRYGEEYQDSKTSICGFEAYRAKGIDYLNNNELT